MAHTKLYENAKAMEHKKEKMRQEAQKEAYDKEMEEVSFHPQIFTHPKTHQQRDPDARPEDYLIFKKMQRDMNI